MSNILDPRDRFELPFAESESDVLPLDERGMKSIHINTLGVPIPANSEYEGRCFAVMCL